MKAVLTKYAREGYWLALEGVSIGLMFWLLYRHLPLPPENEWARSMLFVFCLVYASLAAIVFLIADKALSVARNL